MNPIRTLITFGLLSAALCAHAQEQFKTPEAAVDALDKAISTNDEARLDQLFGPDYKAFHEGQQADAALANMRRERFVAGLKEFRSISEAGKDKRVLYVGSEGWPFPIPIVRKGSGWAFDGKAGIEELRNRLVGANELNAVAALDYYVTAQRTYAADDTDSDGVVEYAQRFASQPGKRDGLYWEDPEDEDGLRSPLGPLLGLAELAMGAERTAGEPFLGYRFRILTGQGAAAKAGAYDYLVNGHMVGGFAAVAWPAEYGETGVMTFVINQDGVIYERDLGAKTADAAAAMTKFDPGEGWAAVDDNNLLGDEKSTASK